MKKYRIVKHFLMFLFTLKKAHFYECEHYYYGTIDNTSFDLAVDKRIKIFEYYNT